MHVRHTLTSYPHLCRLTCRRFSNLVSTAVRSARETCTEPLQGVIHQFSRVTTRFSRKGLERLERIAGQPHIAGRVKKFSYMVPFFYDQGRERIQELLHTRPESFSFLDIEKFQKKVNEQTSLLNSRKDAHILHFALQRFTSLQHIQILRLQDQEDAVLITYMRGHNELNGLVPTWPPACLHSAKTIGQASNIRVRIDRRHLLTLTSVFRPSLSPNRHVRDSHHPC